MYWREKIDQCSTFQKLAYAAVKIWFSRRLMRHLIKVLFSCLQHGERTGENKNEHTLAPPSMQRDIALISYLFQSRVSSLRLTDLLEAQNPPIRMRRFF